MLPVSLLVQRSLRPVLLAASALLVLTHCARHESPVLIGDREQSLEMGNQSEPSDLDPQTISTTADANLVMALDEGLLAYEAKDLHPLPGVADHWESSPDAKVWTFHLRPNAKWSNGDSVTADDFVYSYRRMLSAKLGSEYAFMLFHLENGQAYYDGKIKDFSLVGAKAIDSQTLVLTLWHPLPYLPNLVVHTSWYPVHRATIEKFGAIDARGTAWTRPGNFVGNGPFNLADWKPHQVIRMTKSPTYWDQPAVKLQQLDFFPIEDETTEEAAFRAGQLHTTAQVPVDKIAAYKADPAGYLRQATSIATYYYRFNVTKPPLSDARVRRALSLAIDRAQLVERVAKGGQQPAGNLTPPGTGGFFSRTTMDLDVPQARRLLAEAGYPGGRGFPHVEILYNSSEQHQKLAEAIQQMWRKNLGVEVGLYNQEGKVWVDSMRQGTYQIARYGWFGDFLDPSTFLDLMTGDNTNNLTNWDNAEYDQLIKEARMAADNNARYEYFQRCEQILAEQVPIMPLYFYERNTLVRPEVHGWYDNLLDIHPLKAIYLTEPK